MKVHLYTICWNEADMLGFMFRHYDSWVDRYIVYNDGSTDDSVEILKKHPKVELRQFEWRFPGRFTRSTQYLENMVWKESKGKADWVVIIDVDEHLFVPGVPMPELLNTYKTQGITIAPALGYQMLTEKFPEPDEHLCHTRTRGAPFSQMNKMALFNPNAIEEINTSMGRHRAEPVGNLKFPKRDELLLLHYKYTGFDRIVKRYASMNAKESALRKKHGEPYLQKPARYSYTREQFRIDWESFDRIAVDVSQPNFQGRMNHLERLWWWKSNPDRHWWSDWGLRIHRKYARIRNMWNR